MKIVLASQSPRRHEILNLVKINHDVIPSFAKETITSFDNPSQVVLDISLQKASEVASRYPQDVIIGADTVVVIDNKILGKPHNREAAISMLQQLSGRTHYVLTGVSVMHKDKLHQFVEISEVTFYNMSENEINDYIDNEYVYDKAGSYAIQGMCAKYIKSIKGDYYNIVGLPISKLYQLLKEYMYI